jgi:hypothetical protein
MLALHDEEMARVVLEDGVIELRDALLAWPVPELKNGRNQADARDVVGKAIFAQKIERRRMSRGGARVRLRAAIVVEEPDRQAAAANEPCAKQPDRATAGDQDSPVVGIHPVSLPNRARHRDKPMRRHRFLTEGAREAKNDRH